MYVFMEIIFEILIFLMHRNLYDLDGQQILSHFCRVCATISLLSWLLGVLGKRGGRIWSGAGWSALRC